MKPKEWLFKHGHITEIGRGRLSREHIALIQEAVKAGTHIEGYSVSSVPATAGKPEKAVVKTPKPSSDTVADIGEPLRDERTLEAFSGTKSVGMRTVCNICRNSLTYCFCPQPRVWVDFDREGMVEFRVRKNLSRKG